MHHTHLFFGILVVIIFVWLAKIMRQTLDKRIYQMNLRLTPTERSLIYEKAAKQCLRPQDYIRQVLIEGKSP